MYAFLVAILKQLVNAAVWLCISIKNRALWFLIELYGSKTNRQGFQNTRCRLVDYIDT